MRAEEQVLWDPAVEPDAPAQPAPSLNREQRRRIESLQRKGATSKGQVIGAMHDAQNLITSLKQQLQLSQHQYNTERNHRIEAVRSRNNTQVQLSAAQALLTERDARIAQLEAHISAVQIAALAAGITLPEVKEQDIEETR